MTALNGDDHLIATVEATEFDTAEFTYVGVGR
jgi:hypothetical protein